MCYQLWKDTDGRVRMEGKGRKYVVLTIVTGEVRKSIRLFLGRVISVVLAEGKQVMGEVW